MDKFIIPQSINWFSQSIAYCTPDNGFIYGGTSKIVYIPPPKSCDYRLKELKVKKKLNCFALCPNFKETRRVAVMVSDCQLLIYNFDTQELIKAHKGHCDDNHYNFSAVTFTTGNYLLSSVNSDMIKYCLLSNTYKLYPEFTNRNPITIMKRSPKDSELVAAGTKNGLILLIDSEKMEIKVRLRGQDTEITSLDFLILPVSPKGPLANEKQSMGVDDTDLFDIYKTDRVEDEFGVYHKNIEDKSDDEEANEAAMKEKVHNTVDFNFLEACNDLKDQILSNDNGHVVTSNTNNTTYDDNKEQYEAKDEENASIDLSIESNPSSHTPVLTEESLNFIDECQKMKELDEKLNDDQDIIVLASGSRECVVYLWDIIDHTVLHKIRWHPKAKSVLPAIFTNVVWINKQSLLFTDNNGDIIEHKINFDEKNKKITDQRQKMRSYDVKGALNICKSDDSSLIWISSIHRQICCIESKNLSKVVSLDTLQIRIHYVVENPIDSNVIAIGGNDKRLLLWNTSEVNQQHITLKPFMNKIQSSVLCIAWHPEKDNVLAFSTREGRVGVLDINKSSNIPVILESFTTSEIYSICWAKFTDTKGTEMTILLACSSGKFVFYNYVDFKVHRLSQFKNICSVATAANLLALGTSSGMITICDMSHNFKVLASSKICQKYIGMMTWYENKLAIGTEKGIVLVKDLSENVNEDVLAQNKILLEHQQKRVFSVRFNKTGEYIVACNMNGYIDVWSLLNDPIIVSTIYIDSPAFSAIFMPSNEDFIICGGQETTVQTFEWKKYKPLENIEKSIKSEDKLKSIEYGILSEMTTISKYNKKRRVKKKATPNNSIIDVTKEFESLKLNTKKISTIFTSANREISVNPLNFIEMLLLENSERELSLNEIMFAHHGDVKKMIDKELEHGMKSLGTIILPQLTDDLRNDIIKRIDSKTLTDVHVAVAPTVSYDLWKKSCLAYGKQCIENDEFIRAVPYLLAVNDIDYCIEMLSESKYFREAYIIAKMRKDESNAVFDEIMQKWVNYLDYSGNYETAAAL